MMPIWLRKLFPTPRPTRRRRPAAAPRLIQLEDRATPATLDLTGGLLSYVGADVDNTLTVGFANNKLTFTTVGDPIDTSGDLGASTGQTSVTVDLAAKTVTSVDIALGAGVNTFQVGPFAASLGAVPFAVTDTGGDPAGTATVLAGGFKSDDGFTLQGFGTATVNGAVAAGGPVLIDAGAEVLNAAVSSATADVTILASGGAVAVTADVTAAGPVTIDVLDKAAGDQSVTIAPGVALTSTGDAVTVSAGDDLKATGAVFSAAAIVDLRVDNGLQDATGNTADLTGATITAPGGATVRGNNQNDTFRLSKYTAVVIVNGQAGTDSLILDGQAANGVTHLKANQFSLGGGTVATVGIESVSLQNVPAVTVAGTVGNDVLELKTDAAGNPTYLLNGATVGLPAGLASFTFNAGNGSDRMIVRLKAGEGLPAGTIVYDGQGAAGDSDRLAVFGTGQSADVNLTPTAAVPGQGTVTIGASILQFTNLEPVDVTGMAAATVTFGGTDDAVTVAAGALFTDATQKAVVVSGTTDGLAFESVALANNGLVTLNTLPSGGNDTVTVSGTGDKADHGNLSLSITTGGTPDAVTITGAVSLGGDLAITSGLVSVTAGGSVDVGGMVSITTDDEVTIDGPVSAVGPVVIDAFGVTVNAAVASAADLSLLAGGGAVAVNADVTADGPVTIDVIDQAAGDQSVTIAPGVTVASNADAVTISAGDDLIAAGATLSAADVIDLRVDAGVQDATGNTADLTGATITVPGGVLVRGGSKDDTIRLTRYDADVTVNGLAGTDTLFLDGQGANAFTATGNVFSLGGGTVTPAGIETVRLVNGAGTALTVNGTGGNDTLVLETVGGSPTYVLNGGPRVFLPAGLTDFAFNGLGGNDKLIANLAAGEGFAVPGVTFDGGAGADALAVNGAGQAADVDLAPAAGNLGRGTVVVGASFVAFGNLEPVDMTGMAVVNLTFGGGTDDTVTVAPGALFANPAQKAITVSGTSGGLTFESVALANNGLVTLNTLPSGGNDTVTVSGTGNKADHGNQSLQVQTGAGTDTVTITGAVSLAADFVVTSGAITVAAGGSVDAGGVVTLGGATAVTANGSLTAGGDLTLVTGPDVNDTGDVQDVTVGAGVSLTSTAGNVILTAADDLDATGAGTIAAPAGTVTLTIDAGSAETAAANQGGSALLVLGDIIAAGGATLTGGDFADTFTVTKYTAPLTITGNNPAASPGDTVCLDGGPGKLAVTVNGTADATFAGGGTITFAGIEDLCFQNVDDVTVNGTAGDDTLVLASNGGAPFYTLNGGSKVTLPAGLTRFAFFGGTGSDTLIVQLTAAADTLATIAQTVAYDGEGVAGDSDVLRVDGTGQTADVNLTPTAAATGQGTIVIGAAVLTFTNLEPVDVTGMALVNVTFSGPTDDDAITVSAGTLATDPATKAVVVGGTAGGLPVEPVALFGNGRVVVNTLPSAGNDTVTVTGTGDKADHQNANLEIQTGAGTDAVAITGDVSLAGDLRVTSGTVTVATGKAIDVGGAVALDAAGNLTSDGTITAGGDITLAAGGSVTVAAVLAGGTATITAATAVTVNGTAGDDVLVLETVGGVPSYVLNGARVFLPAGLPTFAFNGLGGDDKLIANLAAGEAFLAPDVTFDGGAGADVLAVRGNGQAADVDLAPVAGNLGRGTVVVGTTVLAFNNLEPVDVTGMAVVTVTFAGPTDDDTVAVSAGKLFTNPAQKAIVVGGTAGGLPVESVALANNGRVIVNTLPSAGNDKVTVSGTGSAADHGNQNLDILTGGGTDAVAITGAVSLAGDLTITSGSVAVGGTVTVGGVVTISADRSVAVTADVTAGGTVQIATGPDTPTAGDQTVTIAAGVTVQSTGGNVAITSADDLLASGANLLAPAGAVTLAVDAGGAADATGGKANLVDTVLKAAAVTVTGGDQDDTFLVSAGYDVLVNLDGGAGTDTLRVAGTKVVVSPCTVSSAAKQLLNYVNVETVRLDGAGDPTRGAKDVLVLGDLCGPQLVNDTATLERTGAAEMTLTVSATDGMTVKTQTIFTPALDAFAFEGLTGDDCLILRYNAAFGSPFPTSGIVTYKGGVGTNKAAIRGSGAETAEFAADAVNANTGTVVLGADVLTFQDAQGLDLTNLGGVVIAPNGGADVLTVAEAATGFCLTGKPALKVSGTSDLIPATTVAVWNVGALTIDTIFGGPDGNDTVTVTGANNGHKIGSLTIQTGNGNDAVSITGPATFDGPVSASSGGTVSVSASVTSNTAGITLSAGTNLTVTAALTAANPVALAVGVNGAGGTADLSAAQINAPSATLTGGDGADTFRVVGYTAPLTIDGKDPTTAPGDTLVFDARGQAVNATVNSFQSGMSAPVTYTNIETVSVLNSGAFTLAGTAGDDKLTLTRSGANLVYQFAGQPAVAVAGPPSFAFNAGDGNDCLILRYTAGGSPVALDGIVTYDGGTGTNAAAVFGTGAEVAEFNADAATANKGVVVVGADVLAITNSQGLDLVNLAGAVIAPEGGDDVLTVDEAATGFCLLGKPNLKVSGTTGGTAATTVAVWNVGGLTIDTLLADGNDTVTVNGAANGHNIKDLTIQTGSGTDTVTIAKPVTVSGNLTVTSQTVTVQAGANLTAGGKLTITNDKTLTLNPVAVSAGGDFAQQGVGPVQLAAGKVTVVGATITFAGSIDGPADLVLNSPGLTRLGGPVGGTTPLASLTTDGGAGTAIDGGLVKTTGAIRFDDPVTYSKATSVLTTGSGAVTFNGTVNPTAAGLDLTVGGPNADVTFQQAVGNAARVGTLTVPDARNVTFAGTLTATALAQNNGTGATTFKGAVDVTNAVTINNVPTVAVNGTLKADSYSQTNGTSTAFNGAVTVGGAVSLTNVKAVTVNAPLTAGGYAQTGGSLVTAGTVTVNGNGPVTLAGNTDVTIGAALSAGTLTQTGGTGTTAINGPVALGGGTAVTNFVTGGSLNLQTKAVVLTANVTAANPVVFQVTNGVSQTGGAVVAPRFYLNGTGKFDLNQPGNDATDTTAGLFVNLTDAGPVLFTDKNSLSLAPDAGAAGKPAIRTANGTVTLTTRGDAGTPGDFSATSPADGATNKQTLLIDVGTAVFQVFPGVGRPAGQKTSITFITEATAGMVILGRQPGASGPENVANDTFFVRPAAGAPVFVNGNFPTRANPELRPWDTLSPQFFGIANASLTSTGVGNGFFTFPGSPFQQLTFTSIETLGGQQLEIFAVQTGPRTGSDKNEFAVRLRATLTVPGVANSQTQLAVGLAGAGTIANPFVVSPVLANPVAPFGAPRVTAADVNGDGTPDLIVANGPGDSPLVTIINGVQLLASAGAPISLQNIPPDAILAQFYAYEPTFQGGVQVAAADLNGDGKAELVLGAGNGGGPRVRVVTLDFSRPATDRAVPFQGGFLGGKPLDFFAFAEDTNFRTVRGGVNVAVGDVTNDGVPDLVVGAGVGGGPRVQVYDGKTGAIVRDFFAYDASFRGGVFVDAGRFDAGAAADVLTAPGPGGGPHIKVFLSGDPTRLGANFFADFVPSTSLVGSDNGLVAGVGGIAFGPSTGMNGDGQSILVGSPRGQTAQVLRYDPDPANPRGVRLVFPDPTKPTDPNLVTFVTSQPGQGLVAPVDQLRDGTTVGGFTIPPI